MRQEETMSKMKIDIGLGKAAAINSIGNMASQSMQNNHEKQMLESQEEKAKIASIEDYEFSSDPKEFVKQFIGMCEDYKATFSLASDITKAYYSRMEKEMKVLMATDTELYNKAKPLFDDVKEFLAAAEAKDKKTTKIALIVVLVLLGLIIAGGVIGSATGFFD